MKYIIPVFLLVSVFLSCKKVTDITPKPQPAFPDNWGMVGYMGDADFMATSLNASLVFDSLAGNYELNVNGWDKNSDDILYFHYDNFKFGEKKIYALEAKDGAPGNSFAWHQKRPALRQLGVGSISIDNTTDSLIKGEYHFAIEGDVLFTGVFTIKPNFSYK